MSIEDRDWYREDFKRRQAIGTQRPIAKQQDHRQPVTSLPNLGAGSVLIFGLFLLTVFSLASFFI
jgi:hypothetical protein